MRKTSILAAAGALLIAAVYVVPFGENLEARQAAAALLEAPGVSVERDRVYCVADGVSLRMDVYRGERTSSPAPALVYIHGGGWHGGDKAAGDDMRDVVALARHGYVVASINYRVAPRHRFPAQIHDAKCAVRHLRAHAAVLGVDPGRIGAWGASAGAHLAALLALTVPDDGLEGPHGRGAHSSAVQAVVDLYGPVDLTAPDLPARTREIVRAVFGDDAASQRRASPLNYVRPGGPPFLIFHGAEDQSVPVSQSRAMHARLLAAGVPARLVVVRGARHVLEADGEITPTREEISLAIAKFFDETLRPAPFAAPQEAGQ